MPLPSKKFFKKHIINANPLYDVVFKVLMENLEVAREFLEAITGLTILSVTLLSQEHGRKDGSGKIRTLRIDFRAVVLTKDGLSFEIIIELQKQTLQSNALRFRRYLASVYSGVSEMLVEGEVQTTTLPIISIYLLGFNLSGELPAVIEIQRQYRDLIAGETLDRSRHSHPFIERLTHDAYFIQIPKISGRTDTRLESVLSIFDQSCRLEGDNHRLKFDEARTKKNRFLDLVFRILKRLQGDAEMEQLMSLEDTFLLEQQMLADEVRNELRKEQKLREQEQKLREQEQKEKEGALKRSEEALRQREEEQRRREQAEQRVKQLEELLKEMDGGKDVTG